MTLRARRPNETKNLSLGGEDVADGGESMRITFPHLKKRVRFSGWMPLYIVCNVFSDGESEFASIWDLPYTSRNYLEAVRFKEKIIKRALKYKVWKRNKFFIAKVSV